MSKGLLVLLAIVLLAPRFFACSKSKAPPKQEKIPKVGPIKLNPHPSTLEGKTVVLRWNGKFNGNNFLNAVADLLTQRVKDVKVIKMWEANRDTALVSDSLEKSEKIADEIVGRKPDLVIAAQSD